MLLAICSSTTCAAADLENDVSNFTAYAASYFQAHKTYAPLGHDPTFKTTSSLWDYELIGRQGEYYNTSQVAAAALLYHTCVVVSNLHPSSSGILQPSAGMHSIAAEFLVCRLPLALAAKRRDAKQTAVCYDRL